MSEKYVEKFRSTTTGEVYTVKDPNIDTKQDILVSGENIKTINNESILGSGNISIGGGSGGTTDYDQLDNRPQISGVTLTGNKTAGDLGLVSIPTIVEDLLSTEVTISKVNANTNYYYGTLASLTIQDNDDSPFASNIFLDTGATFTFTITDTLKTSGDYELLPNKSYKLTICNNILTVERVVDHELIPVDNLIDHSEEVVRGFYNAGGTWTQSNDFSSLMVEVEPGQKLWFSDKFSNLALTFWDENKEYITGSTMGNSDVDYSFSVPTNSNIKYMRMAMRTNLTRLNILATEPFQNYGNLPLATNGVVTGDPSTLDVSTTSTIRVKQVWRYKTRLSTETDDNKYRACFIIADEAYVCGDTYLILGLDSNYKALAIGPTGGKLYIFEGTTATLLTTISDFSLPVVYLKNVQGLDKSSTPFKQVYDTTGIKFYSKDTGELLEELTYTQLNSYLPEGQTMEDTYNVHAIGTVHLSDSKTTSGQTFCAWRSTLPIIKQNAEPEEEGNTDLVDTWWRGKEWYAYGTSMTDESYSGYAVKLAAMTGMNIHNYGKGGSGIIPSLHPGDNVKTRCMRTTDGKAAADLITVEVIPNDRNGTLGTATDTGDETFLGNLNQIIQYLQENCPKAQIVILTATRPRTYTSEETQVPSSPTSANVTGWLNWEDGVKEVCRRNCIQYWDGASNCGLGYHRVKTETSGNTYLRDNIHLTDVGAENLAYYFLNQLKNLPLWHPTYDL